MVSFWQSLRAGRHFNRGQLLAAQQRYDRAAQEYDRALALDPALPHVFLHYALLEADRGRFEPALRWLQQGLEQQPESPVYHTFHGWLLAEAGELEAARRALDQALAWAPENLLTRNGEAYLLFRQGQPAAAVVRLRHDGLCSNQAMQARLLLELEKAVARGHLPTSRAADLPAASLPRLSSSPRRCLKRGVKRLERGRTAEAIALLERAQQLQTDLPKLGFYLGAAYFEAGRYAEAGRVLEAERPQHPEPDPAQEPPGDPFWLYLAATYLRLDRLEEAESCLKHAPDGPDADFCRGLAALRRGRDRDALPLFRRALRHDGALLQRRLKDFPWPSTGEP